MTERQKFWLGFATGFLIVVITWIFLATQVMADDFEIPPGLEDHYLCNSLIEQGYHMTQDEIIACSQNYTWLKISFMDISAEEWLELERMPKINTMQDAYLRFKEWEDDNVVLVESLRIAMEQVARDMVE